MIDRLPLIVLVRDYTRGLSYFDDWRDALASHPGFAAQFLDLDNSSAREEARRLIPKAPFVLVHHSATGDGVERLNALLPAFQSRTGKLAVFVANELNLPLAPMAQKIEFLKRADADLVLTQFLPDTGAWYYGGAGLRRVVTLPHGLNTRAFRPGLRLEQRQVDIAARSHRYGLFVGDMERMDMFSIVPRLAKEQNLSSDIVLDGQRLDRPAWERFLQGAKATIANEAGSFWIDRDDAMMSEIKERIRDHGRGKVVLRSQSRAFRLAQAVTPKPVRQLVKRMIAGKYVEEADLDRHVPLQEAERIQREVFTAARRAPVHTKVISSRHFDAIGTKTLQILTPGRYNDMIQPDAHYLELAPDFSNFAEIARILKDPLQSQRIVDAAYEHAAQHHSYEKRMATLEQTLRSL